MCNISGGSCLSIGSRKRVTPLSRGSVASTLGDNDVKLINLKIRFQKVATAWW
nr:MAG TPA: hypothetical protein [Caudoviricetes sp.]